MTPRLFAPLELSRGTVVELDGPTSHHAIRVLRLGPGAPVELFDGRGQAAAATLISTSPAAVRVEDLHAPAGAPTLHLTLAQCVSAAEKMDWTIETAVELGVAAIAPLQSQRAIVKLSAERAARRHEHWQRLILAACAQSGQNRVPQLQPTMKLEDWLASEYADAAGEARALRLILDPRARQSLSAVMAAQAGAASGSSAAAGLRPTRAAAVLCGPEAGFSESELRLAGSTGWLPAGLGPRVLRTETAGLVALAVLQAGWGDLR